MRAPPTTVTAAVRSAIAEAAGGAEAFAQAAGVDAERPARICTGTHRPTMGELAGLLERAGTGLRVRLAHVGTPRSAPPGRWLS